MKHLIKKFAVSVVSFGLLFFALPTGSASATFYPTNLTRQDAYNAISYFRNNLLFAPYSWNGSVSGCNPGTVSSTFSQAVLDTVNYFRSFNRLPAVTLDAADSSTAQQAALMMLANNQLSHVPPSTWTCYTSVGAAAAGTSNLTLGANGPYAILLYMQDSGPNLPTLGHRRWVLSSTLVTIGSGDTSSGNVLYLDKGTRPAGIPKFSGWPAQNYFPEQLAPDRWSLSNSDGTVDMSSARVSVTMHGVTSAKTTLYMPVGYGDDAIAWDMPYLYTDPFPDLPVTVTVSNLKNYSGSSLANYTYTTTLFDMYSATPPSAGGGMSSGGGGGTTTGGDAGGSSAEGSKTSGGGTASGSSSGQTSTGQSQPSAPLTVLKVNGTPLDTKMTVTQPAGQPLVLSGKTVPNGVVTLTIHSTPKTVTTTADKDGNWSYTVTGLEPGKHYVEATVTDPSTKLTSAPAKLISFTLTAAKVPAATAKAVAQPVEKTSSTGLYVALAVLVVLLLGGGGWYGWRLRRKKQAGGTEPPVSTSSKT